MIRLFVALPIPETIGKELSPRILPPEGYRPVPWNQMHITLAFAAEVPPALLDRWVNGLHLLRKKRFPVSLGGFDVFSRGKRSSLYASVQRNRELARLHRSVSHQSELLNIPVDRRPFVPHVTIARFSNQNSLETVWSILKSSPTGNSSSAPRVSSDVMASFVAREFRISASVRTKNGSHYTDIASYTLA